MKVTVFGTGHVGLTQAVCLTQVGHSVPCKDDALAAAGLTYYGIGRRQVQPACPY